MGEELCRNEDWLKESASYTACAFKAVEVLRHWPEILRPWVAPFLPECKETRARIARCREIVEPYVAARRAAKAKAIARGESPPVYDDSLEWFEKEYERYDAATSQYVYLIRYPRITNTDTSQTPKLHVEIFSICMYLSLQATVLKISWYLGLHYPTPPFTRPRISCQK